MFRKGDKEEEKRLIIALQDPMAQPLTLTNSNLY